MRRILAFGFEVAVAFVACGGDWGIGEWPTLKEYDGDHLYRIALPVGGIGTGTISFGGRGELRDIELTNEPAKGFTGVEFPNDSPFFAIRAKGAGKPFVSLLQGPLYSQEYLHFLGRGANNYGFPRFAEASFRAAYPFGTVALTDKASPVSVEVRAFNPFIPGDSEASSLPVATFTVAVSNLTAAPLEVSVMGALRNFIGTKMLYTQTGEAYTKGATNNVNAFRTGVAAKGLYLTSKGVDSGDQAWGTLALVTADSGEVSYRTDSIRGVWFEGLRDIWTDFASDGRLTQTKASSGDKDPWAALAVSRSIPSGACATFTFSYLWSFPNRRDWNRKTIVGNHYATVYPDAWNAVERILPRLPELERRTRSFVEAFLKTDYPEVVKEAALFNLATLRSPTVFRLPSGHLMGWEGVSERDGLCCGTCTHVWNYEQATGFLFGDLARTMRDVEFNYATRTNGLMLFRADLPLSDAAGDKASSRPAADGQMGTVLKAYREWLNCGDRDWLKAIWPRVRLVLSFAWSKDGTWNWDADGDGVMEGRQHNTMDVDYFGPNPQMQFWYLAALRAGEELAKAAGDADFAAECAAKFAAGRAKGDRIMFNGEYYEHKQTPGDTHKFQLGPGCLVDQLVGQTFARLLDLGALDVDGHAGQAIRSVWKYNRVEDASRYFCSQRSYMLGNESGLLMASWPRGMIDCPFPYSEEVMTGFEYVAAVEMFQAGMEKEAVETVRSVRERHDGAKRNPFSEPECGHHYARSMASWWLHLAWSGFHYNAAAKTMRFTNREGRWFWSNGSAWGTFARQGVTVELSVVEGSLELAELRVDGFKDPVARSLKLGSGERAAFFALRDSVRLRADCHLPPAAKEGKVGTSLVFSPYKAAETIADSEKSRADRGGYALVHVDCRGTGGSEGRFTPYRRESVLDSEDVLGAVVAQRWSNGRVVMSGGSYVAWTQFCAMRSGHPALVACAPSVMILDPYWLYFSNGCRVDTFQSGWHRRFGGTADYDAFVSHTKRSDPFWEEKAAVFRLDESKADVFYQGGWFDMIGLKTMETYNRLRKNGRRVFLRMGPWAHGVNVFADGGIDFKALGGSVTEDLELDFLEKRLRGEKPQTDSLPGQILLYVMGRNEWRYETEWPLKGTKFVPWPLTKDNVTFRHDPANPVPTCGGRMTPGGGIREQSAVAAREDVLKFTGEVLKEDLEVTGDVKAHIVFSSTSVTNDIAVKLVDVYPDGKAYGVVDSICRADDCVPGEMKTIDFPVDSTAYVFLKGHRIRIDVAGSSAPHYEVNPHAATITVHPGSQMLLPTIPARRE